jgi:hypothetical protein
MEVHHGAREASFEAKALKAGLAGVGRRGDVFGDGEWRIGSGCAA